MVFSLGYPQWSYFLVPPPPRAYWPHFLGIFFKKKFFFLVARPLTPSPLSDRSTKKKASLNHMIQKPCREEGNLRILLRCVSVHFAWSLSLIIVKSFFESSNTRGEQRVLFRGRWDLCREKMPSPWPESTNLIGFYIVICSITPPYLSYQIKLFLGDIFLKKRPRFILCPRSKFSYLIKRAVIGVI